MAELEYGTVRGQYLLVQSTVTRSAEGMVVFTPVEPDEIVQGETAYTRQAVRAVLNGDGWLHAAGNSVDYLQLPAGRWRVEFSVAGVTADPFEFDVTAGETVQLPSEAPLRPSPAVHFVVNEAVYTETLEARNETLVFRDAAEQFAAAAQAPTNEVVDERIAAKRGSANGVAALDANGDVPDAQLPDRLSAQGISDTIGAAVAPKANAADVYSRTAADTTFVAGATTPLYADAFGCKGDGITDDTAALTALYAAAKDRAKSASVFGAVTKIIFRGGRYIDSLARLFDFRVVIAGEGRDNTILYRKNGSTGDFLTFAVSYSGVQDITVDGNKTNCPGAVDNIALNAYRTSVRDCTVTKARGNNITIGKAGEALGHVIYGVGVSLAGAYGIQTIAGSGSTDGMWTLLDVGQSGKSGVRLDQGAQNILGLHVWGNGLEDSTDKHGIHVNSSSNVIVAAQSETNLGDGVYISGAASRDNEIDVKAWGNMQAGIRIFAAPNGRLSGRAYRNGVANEAAQSASTSFAGVLNDSGTDWIISVSCRDDSALVPAASYVTAPTYPFPGRAAGGSFTQTYGYAEIGTADRNMLVGCKMRKEDHKTGALLIVGNSDRLSPAANDFGAVSIPVRSVVSGAVRAPADSDFIEVNTSGSEITTVAGGYTGRRVTIRFVAATPGTIRNSATLRLSGNIDWTPNQYATLSLIYDGTSWYETGRKA